MVKVTISGFVQGVGFRYFVKKNALKMGLKGWVKNTSDGNVEAVFDGEQEKVKEMIELCRKGPIFAKVKDIKIQALQVDQELRAFEIVK